MADQERASASIANSKIQQHGLAAGFAPVFQTLNTWETDPHSRLISGFGIALEVVQFLSFVLCPYFMYSQPVVKEIVEVVWASIAPLWYRPFGPFSYSAYIAPIAIAAAIAFTTITLFVLLATKTVESTNVTISHGTRLMAESVAGWLFLPFLHLFLGGMNCSNGTLINFPGEACWTSIHNALLIIGILGLIATVCIGVVINGSLGDLNPHSSRMRSRAHNYVEIAVLAGKVVLVIFFHILVERNAWASFNIIAVIVSGWLLWLHAEMLPFYHHEMNQLRCATFAVAVFVGIVNCVTAYSSVTFAVYAINSFIVAALLPMVAYAGIVVSNIRPNPELTHKLDSLVQLASVPQHTARFPFRKGVMSNDSKMIPLRFRTLEMDILNEGMQTSGHEASDGPSWEAVVTLCSEVLVPYVERVSRATDAELANRFVRMHMVATNLAPSANTLAFATRTHLKSIVRFKRSGITRFHFANFLYVFANRLNMSLQLLNEIDQQIHDQHDALVLYASFKVGIRVKELFGVRDNTHLHTFQRARQHHKDALMDMANFWAKLLESKGDVVGLALLTNQLTNRRESAYAEYERALQSQRGDRQLLSAFASFLEHVMCDVQGAETYRQLADEVAEEKKNRIMRGSRSKNDVTSHVNTRALLEDDIDDDEETAKDSNVATLLRTLIVLLAAVALASITIFVLQRVQESLVTKRLQGVSAFGRAESYGHETVLRSLLANAKWNAANCGNGTCTGSDFRSALQNLTNAEVSMRMANNEATYGSAAPPRTSSTMKYATSLVDDVLTLQTGSLWMSNLFAYFGRAASRTYSTLFSEANMLEGTIEPWMAVHTLSMFATQMVNNMYAGNDFNRTALFFSSNSPTIALEALSRVSQIHITDLTSLDDSFRIGVIIAMIGGIVFVVASYLAFFSTLQAVGDTKSTVLKLFTLIPYPTQEILHNGALNKIEQFEALSAEDEKDVGQSGEDQDLLGPDPAAPAEVEPDEDPLGLRGARRESAHSRSNTFKPIANGGLDDDVRRLSRFFGVSRSASQGHHNVLPSILKNPGKPKPKRKKRVQFRIEGEAHSSGKKLREPKVKLTSKPKDLVMDLEQSMRDIERQSQQETQAAKAKQEQETEKMIHGGLRSQTHATTRARNSDADDSMTMAEIVKHILRPLVAVLLLVSMVVMILALSKNSSVQSSLDDAVMLSQLGETYLDTYQNVEIAASMFGHFGRTVHYSTIKNFLDPESGYGYMRNAVVNLKLLDSSVETSVMSTQQLVERAMNGFICFLTVSVRALSALGLLTLESVPLVSTFTCSDRTITPDFLLRYPQAVQNPSEYVFKGTINSTKDASLNSTDVLNIGLFRLVSKKALFDCENTMLNLRSNRRDILTSYASQAQSSADSRLTLITISTICTVIATALVVIKCIAYAVEYRVGTLSHIRRISGVGVGLLMIVSIVAMATSITTINNSDSALDTFNIGKATLTQAANVMQSFFERERFAVQRYIAVSDPLTLYEFNQNFTTATITSQYTSLLQSLKQVNFPNADSVISGILADDLRMLQIQQVGLWLRAAAVQKASGQTVAPSSSFLSTYDFSQEANSAADSIAYAAEAAYQYSTPATDALRSASDLQIMSRQAVAGMRAFAKYTAVAAALTQNVLVPLHAVVAASVQSNTDSFANTIRICIGFSAAGGALALFLVVLPWLVVLTERIAFMSRVVQQMVETLFTSTLRKCQISLGLLVCLLIAQLVIALLTVGQGEKAGEIIRIGRRRESLLIQSLSSAIRLNASVVIGSGLQYETELFLLSQLSSDLSAARNQLYFADSATSSAFDVVSSLSSTQRSLTFDGGAASLDSQYLTWLATINTLITVSPSIATTVSSTNTLANTYRFSSSMISSVSTYVQTMYNMHYNVLTALRASNDQYDSDMKSAVQRSLVPDVILMVALLLAIVVQLQVVFLPVTEQLRDEQQGTRLLLEMIPQTVRELVPKIQMYLDTGSLIAEDVERKVYERCPKALEFLNMWAHSDQVRECYDILDESTIGQILIDSRGIVQFANKHIPTLLGFNDLEGRNISCLLEEPLRSLHDGFLRRFVTQGTSRVVGGGRDVVALNKSGERVHLYLNLDDAVSVQGAQYFLGSLEKYSPDDVRDGRNRGRGTGNSATAAAAESEKSHDDE